METPLHNLTPTRLLTRFCAFIIDIVFMSILSLPFYIALKILLVLTGETYLEIDEAAKQYSTALVGILYLGIYQSLKGATPGLKMMGSRVAMLDGSHANINVLMKRYALHWGPGIFILLVPTVFVFLYLCYCVVNLCMLLFRRDHRYIADIVMGTIVLQGRLDPPGNAEPRKAPVKTPPTSFATPVAAIPRPQISQSQKSLSEDQLNTIYEIVAAEIELSKFKPGLLARADVEAEGDTVRSRRLYIKYRTEQLIAQRMSKSADNS